MRTGGSPNTNRQGEQSSQGFFSWPLGFFSTHDDKSSLRSRRAQKLKSLLSASRGSKPIKLPTIESSALSSASSSSSTDKQPPPRFDDADDEQNNYILSNAVPFSQPQYTPRTISTSQSSETQQYEPRPDADQLFVVLPWLFTAPGELEQRAVEYIASQLALKKVHLLDFSRFLGSIGPSVPSILGESIAWVGATPIPSATVATAAALHRLAHRCGGALSPPPDIGGSAVLLSYREEEKHKAAEALAIYFHLYGGMDAKDSLSAAGDALRCPAPQLSVLEAAVQEMACCGKGWLQRLVLTWEYGGGRVEATGDAVGGWDRFVPLQFDVRHRKWKVQCWGLPPGQSTYKFIVDGRWCNDVAAPSQVDAFGNTNNVAVVLGCASRVGLLERTVVDAGDGMAASLMMSDDEEDGEEEDDDDHDKELQLKEQQVNLMGMSLGNSTTSGSGSSGSDGSNSDGDDDDDDDIVMQNSDEVIRLVENPVPQENEDDLSPEERLRLARFGSAILAYYGKSATVHRSMPVKF